MIKYASLFKKKFNSPRKVPEGFREAALSESLIHHYQLNPYIAQIKQLVAVTDEHFELYYFAPLKNLIALLQPLDKDHIIQRLQCIINGLTIRRSIILPSGIEPEKIRLMKDSWTYAVFASLVLYKLHSNILRHMIVYKSSINDSSPTKQWCPLIALLEPPQIYKIIGSTDISPKISICLLFSIFPQISIHWLYQNNELFNCVSTLSTNPDPNTQLGQLILNSFDQNFSLSSLTKHNDSSQTSNENQPKGSVFNSDLAHDFQQWLSHEIKCNPNNHSKKPAFFKTGNEVALVSPDIFRQYLEHKGFDWKKVQNEFFKLKLHKINANNSSNFHTVDILGRSTRQVILLSKFDS